MVRAAAGCMATPPLGGCPAAGASRRLAVAIPRTQRSSRMSKKVARVIIDALKEAAKPATYLK